MANLETIMAETNKSYDNSRNALNDQINAIAGDLEAQKNRINAQYAQQGKTLDNQRNYQAQASSMAASRNGGSFGGSAEIANKKYYQQAYVPAVTQMQTNQANDISSAESQANSNRLSLQQTLAQLNDEANRYALQRYDAAKQAEAEERYRQQQLALQRQQIAAQNAANAWLQKQAAAAKSAGNYGYRINNDAGYDFYNTDTGNAVRFGTYYKSRGGDFSNNDLLNAAGQVFGVVSKEYLELQKLINAGYKFKDNTGKNYKAGSNSMLNNLGIAAYK